MRKKSIVLALILIIVSAGIGTGYSLAIGSFRTGARVAYIYDYNVDFIYIGISDNEYIKNVAIETAEIITNNISQVTITNAYPGYKAFVNFTIKNVGADLVVLNLKEISDYDTDALDIQLSGITAPYLF